MSQNGRVYVIDDDAAMRDSLDFLLRSAGFTVRVFETAQMFLSELPHIETGCVVTDVRMPGTDGIEFFGHSFIADPFGRLLAEAGTEPAILVARCDPRLIEETRRNWPFLRDRRIDAYAPILSRYLGSG